MDNKTTYVLVDSMVLPEVISRVIQVNSILSKDSTKNVNEACLSAGISRSAFYKYKDHVFPFYETTRGRVVTLYFVVEDTKGILSNIIHQIALTDANILTINQNIPINGLADVTISIETQGMNCSIKELLIEISNVSGVKKQEILARD